MPSANITTSGNIISDDFIELLREPEGRHDALRPQTFAAPGQPAPKSPDEDLAVAYELLRERWEAVRTEIAGYDLPTLRTRWVIPLLRIFDYAPVYLRGNTQVGNGRDAVGFSLSHRGWPGDGAPIVDSVPWSQDLDTKPAGKRGARSPHDELQHYLNLADDQWGIVTSGRRLRLLRDFHHSLTKGYVEFDLEGIFESGDIGDFRAFYRLVHASRFIPDAEGERPLERFHKSSHETGIEVGKKLRSQVKEAIEVLGNGFLHGELLGRLQQDETLCQAYYRELLHLVYRLLFLFFVEQKGWVPMRSPLYVESYSASGLRDRAADPNAATDEHADLWEGLKITFRLVREGFEFPDGHVPAYGGQLFDDTEFMILNGTPLRNRDLLRAVYLLSYFERKRSLYRINYTRLQIDALGSVYEALLDYTPRVLAGTEEVDGTQWPAGSFVLDPRGKARKTTGSYYTDQRLVAQLIDSALRPVIADRLSAAKTPKQREQALLSITVCDPACGSAAFLVAAMNALGEELAKLRAGDEQPTEQQLRQAKRDVLQHCIFGVDINPMAVELAKVSLWIAAAMPDLPLNFLDNHIKCGNSLIGVFRDRPVEVPDDAFNAITGDDRKVASAVRKRNREERSGQRSLDLGPAEPISATDASAYHDLITQPERLPEEVEAKERKYQAWRASETFGRQRLECDIWCAAFFWPLTDADGWLPTTASYLRALAEPGTVPAAARQRIDGLAGRHRFFHWRLEFPDIFARGGFDCVLGNPPWETWQTEEEQFFAQPAPEIARLPGERRKRAIQQIESSASQLGLEWQEYRRHIETAGKFMKRSGRLPFAVGGKINLYAVFVEIALGLLGHGGRAGLIVPCGIATDDSNKALFSHLVGCDLLAALHGFENEAFIFPGTHHAFKFCLLALGRATAHELDVVFLCRYPEHVTDTRRHFGLTREDFALLNPNTGTCPVFRTRADAELTKVIYRGLPVLVRDSDPPIPEGNPWGISFMQMINMTGRSGAFKTAADLPRGVPDDLLPLYEAKMMHQFDHRWGTYEGATQAQLNAGILPQPSDEQKRDHAFGATPRYWIAEREVVERLVRLSEDERRELAEPDEEDALHSLRDRSPRWLAGFRDVTSNVVERTAIFAVLPRVGAGHTLPLIFAEAGASLQGCLLANLNALVSDYVLRNKMGGGHLSYFVLEQLPVLPPSRYSQTELDFIVPRVLELTYTAWDLKPFAEDLGHDGPPFTWDPDRRALLRAELDAYYAHLYGLTRKQLRYILDPHDLTDRELADILDPTEDPPDAPRTKDFPGETFRVLKEKELARYGEYRTRRLVLEAWDRMFGEGK